MKPSDCVYPSFFKSASQLNRRSKITKDSLPACSAVHLHERVSMTTDDVSRSEGHFSVTGPARNHQQWQNLRSAMVQFQRKYRDQVRLAIPSMPLLSPTWRR